MALKLKRRWQPHPGQQAVLKDKHRFRIVACGRRWGKSEMCAHMASEWAWLNPGANIWWVAPTYTDAYNYGWGEDPSATGVVDILPEATVEKKYRDDPRRVQLVNGSQISFRSADRPESLVGAGLSLLIIDEAGTVADHTWYEELRPTLADEQAPMIAIGTPKGPNWFKTLHARGDDKYDPTVMSWSAPTYENPHIPDAEVDSMRQDMPDLKFRQEILAEFVEESGGVFTAVDSTLAEYDPDDASPPQKATFEAPFTIGVDLGRAENFSVVTCLDANGKLAGYRRLRQTSWSVIQGAIEAVADRRQPHTIFIDANRDNSLIEDLERAGYRIEPMKYGNQKKRDLIDNLAVRIEKGTITLPARPTGPNDELEPVYPELVNELKIFEYDTTAKGNVTYQAPPGSHDDCVDSLAFAAQKPKATAGTW